MAGIGINRAVATAGCRAFIRRRRPLIGWRGAFIRRCRPFVGRHRRRFWRNVNLHVGLHAGFTIADHDADGVSRGGAHFRRGDGHAGGVRPRRVHVARYAPGVGQHVAIRIGSLRIQRVGCACFKRHRFQRIHNRSLVRFWRFVHNLNVNGVTQTFRIGNGQTERQILIAGDGGDVKARFRAGALVQCYGRTGDLRPLIGDRIAIRVGRGRTVQRDRRRAGYDLINCGRDWRMVGYNRLNRRRTPTQQAFVHRVQNVAVIRVDRPGEQAAEVVSQDVFTFRRRRTGVFIGNQVAGGFIENIRRFRRSVVTVFPAWFAFVFVNNLTIINHARLPGAFHRAGSRTGKRIVAGIAMHASPATAIHPRAHHDLAWLHALRQQRIDAIFRGVFGVRFPLCAVQRRLVPQIGVAPAAVEVVAHQEDVIHILLRLGVVHVFNFVLTGTDSGGQLVSPTGFGRQFVKHGAQIVHQCRVGRFILLRVAQRFILTAAAREFPVNIYAVEEFPGLQEILNGSNKPRANRAVMHLEERIGKRPSPNRWQDFQIRVRFFQRHQLTEVAFIRVIPVRDASLRFLQRRPRIVDRHGIVLSAIAGAFQRFKTVAAFDGFQAVIDAVAAANGNKAVQDMVQISRRDFIYREITSIHAPFREVRAHHFIGMLSKRFIVFLHGGIQRQQMATVGIRHNNQLADAFRTPAGIT